MVSSIGSQMSSMASSMFSKLDTSNKGYINKSDLQSAFSKLSGSNGSPSADDVFKQMDGNGDDKVTKEEMITSLQKISDQLDSQFQSSRMQTGGRQGGSGDMPPMPPGGMAPLGGADNAGMTKDQLTQMQKDGGSNNKLDDLVQNFDKADTNHDGKVSMTEVMAYDKSSSTSSSSSTSADSTGMSKDQLSQMLKDGGSNSKLEKLVQNFDKADTNHDGKVSATEAQTYDKSSSMDSTPSTSSSNQNDQVSVLLKMMQLMQAYNVNGQDEKHTGSSLFSASA
jgi:Ca2+-binding EF-hand superfamily protein